MTDNDTSCVGKRLGGRSYQLRPGDKSERASPPSQAEMFEAASRRPTNYQRIDGRAIEDGRDSLELRYHSLEHVVHRTWLKIHRASARDTMVCSMEQISP